MPFVDLNKLSPVSFPSEESDSFEFKSSQTSLNEIKKKLNRAASAFGNSGGGCFIYGVDDGTGNADGGIPPNIGKQDLREWIDQLLANVSPTPSYDVRLFDDVGDRGYLSEKHVILAVSFHPSERGPHQAEDHRYYIRAGAHTLPAGHYLVEALWGRRYFQRPVLRHAVRLKPWASDVVQVGIVAVTDAPALDVEVHLSPLGGILKDLSDEFPIRIPVIDRSNPFFMDVGIRFLEERELPKEAKLTVVFKDLAGNDYTYENTTPLLSSASPISIGSDSIEKVAKELGDLVRAISQCGLQ